jgi:hypothetical protein
MAFISALLSNHNNFRNTNEQLLGRDCDACMVESMENTINILAMVPNEALYSRIVGMVFISTIGELISGVCAKNIDIILKIWGYFDFMLEDEGYIILEHCRRVHPPLGKHSQMKSAKRCLEGHDVL